MIDQPLTTKAAERLLQGVTPPVYLRLAEEHAMLACKLNPPSHAANARPTNDLGRLCTWRV